MKRPILTAAVTTALALAIATPAAAAYGYGGYGGGYASYRVPPPPTYSPCWHWNGYRWYWACVAPQVFLFFDFDRFHRFDRDRFDHDRFAFRGDRHMMFFDRDRMRR
jgi:hypothetical protein